MILPNTLDLYYSPAYPTFPASHDIASAKSRYATSALTSTSLMQFLYLGSYNCCPVLQNCLHRTLRIRKMPTYKVVHSEYFCATMIVLQQFIISGRHGLQASTLHSPRPLEPCPTTQTLALNSSAHMISRRVKWIGRGHRSGVNLVGLSDIF